MKYDKPLPKGSKKVTMKQFEGTKADKRADEKALRQINAKRKGKR